MICISYLRSKILIYLACKAEMALLLAEKINVLKKYADFLDIFSKKFAIILSNYSDINKYIIDLKSGKPPPYKSIYNLGSVKLKILKTYIKANLTNRFI